MEKTADISSIALAVAGFLLAGAWREFHHFKREVQRWQSKIDVVLFGPEGSNGLNGIVKDHEARMRVLEQAAHRHTDDDRRDGHTVVML